MTPPDNEGWLEPASHAEWLQREAEDYLAERRRVVRWRWAIVVFYVGGLIGGGFAFAHLFG